MSEKNIYRNNQRKYYLLVSIGILLLALIFIWAMSHGNYETSFSDVVTSLLYPTFNPNIRRIVLLSRLPRLIGSIFVGAALSISGLVYQELFHNRMASPDILGVSAGSGMGASIAIITGFGFGATSLFAFWGGILSVFFTQTTSMLFGRKTDKAISLILAGIVIGGLMNSTMSFIKYISNDSQLSTITFWLMGGFYNTTYGQLKIAVPMIVLGLGVLYFLRWEITMLRDGESDAIIHGIDAKRLKKVCILTATIITSISICISGTIGWIGLAIPNLVRELVKNDGKKLFTLTLIYGAVFCEICDYLSRTLAKTEIPVGIISGLLGAIMFIAVMFVRREKVIQ